MLYTRHGVKGIRATGIMDGHFWVKLESGASIEFLSPVSDAEQNALIHSPDPMAFLESLRKKYRSIDRGSLLGL